MTQQPSPNDHRIVSKVLIGLILIAAIAIMTLVGVSRGIVADPANSAGAAGAKKPVAKPHREAYEPRRPLDSDGFFNVLAHVPEWNSDASLKEIGEIFRAPATRISR